MCVLLLCGAALTLSSQVGGQGGSVPRALSPCTLNGLWSPTVGSCRRAEAQQTFAVTGHSAHTPPCRMPWLQGSGGEPQAVLLTWVDSS